MKRNIILLMMCIPLLFMLTIFSIGKAVSIVTDIPVSGIKILTQNDDGLISLDMATYQEDLFIEAEVLPVSAHNKEYTYSVSGINGESPADVSVESDGRVILNGTGKAKITVTSNQNAFTDSVVLSVRSSKVLGITPNVQTAGRTSVEMTQSSDDECDFETTLQSGRYAFNSDVYPSNLSNSHIEWTSSNEQILKINKNTGKATAMLSGSAIVSALCRDGINGEIVKNVKVNVKMPDTLSGLTVNGAENGTVACDSNVLSVVLYVETESGEEPTVLPCADVSSSEIDKVLDGQYKITLKLVPDHAQEFCVGITCGGSVNLTSLTFADYTFGVYTAYHTSEDEQMYHKDKSTVIYYANGELDDNDISYTWICSDESIIKLTQNNGAAKVESLKTGTSQLTVTAYRNGLKVYETVKNITVVSPVLDLNFSQNNSTYGISDSYAIGDLKVVNGALTKDYLNIPLKLQTEDGWANFDGNKNIMFESSDENICKVYRTFNQIKADVVETGEVTFSAKWKYSDYFNEKVSASFTFTAVKNGVNVGSYFDLTRATEENKKVVLTDNVMIGKKNATLAELKAMAKLMPTTYDWQFYENRGLGRPNVMYLVEFTNDVYGNGYEINGDYVTRAEDATNSPLLFKGPLDFVSISSASVKAQDNIVFLIRTDGIILDNVVLRGCKDESLINQDTGEFDLTLLNNTGTTLELAASATLKNCRISNGRTVVRIFGGGDTDGKPVVASPTSINTEEERITPSISSCILTTAREFIIKIGSNRALLAQDQSNNFAYRMLTHSNGTSYKVYDAANETDEYFYNNYVITDLLLKNSVLATSGLFAIGMETHFTGEYLYGNNLDNWKKLAATSYASVIRMEGDVKLLDWKKLSNLDSSTLIETTGDLGIGEQFLKMDISAMIGKVATSQAYSSLISVYNGENYVHGGIALYGGGYNYSYVDFTNMTSEALKPFKINLSVMAQGEESDSTLYSQGTLLPKAAGPSDFKFYMYDSTSNMDYITQQNQINSGEAYKITTST